ncbi:IS1096 element passenger TnpR family protein [Paraburkholderia sp. B3]|uniref:IS1096 element passenger TnpR family protein n=1 Tax=Paraburkholderia sp. B3 TaxID=3134791 RepID=UPI003982404A
MLLDLGTSRLGAPTLALAHDVPVSQRIPTSQALAASSCLPPAHTRINDCSRPAGYESFLDALCNPPHSEEAEHYRNWGSSGLDTELFDLRAAEGTLLVMASRILGRLRGKNPVSLQRLSRAHAAPPCGDCQ